MKRCVCGCGRRAVHRHHVVSRGEIKKWAPAGERRRWATDERNLVWMAFDCHLGGQENAQQRVRLSKLPDSVFEFAVELMGAGPAFNYLERYYSGRDERLDALLV